MRVTHLKFWFLLAALCLLPSCMTLTSGREQSVTISSVPGGARATIQPGNQILTTPAQVMLSRRSGYSVLIEKEGFEATSAAMERQLERGVWFNLFFVYFAPIGFAVDFTTGSAYRLAPSIVDVSLRRVGEETPPPTRIKADVTVHEGAAH